MKNIFFSIFLIAFPALLYAQTSNDVEPKVNLDPVQKNLDIDFTRSNMVFNLLVHMNDSVGNTIFLDNKYQFSGQYKKTIDMKNQGKGTYFLEIVEDNKHTNKTIVLK